MGTGEGGNVVWLNGVAWAGGLLLQPQSEFQYVWLFKNIGRHVGYGMYSWQELHDC